MEGYVARVELGLDADAVVGVGQVLGALKVERLNGTL